MQKEVRESEDYDYKEHRERLILDLKMSNLMSKKECCSRTIQQCTLYFVLLNKVSNIALYRPARATILTS